MKNAETCKLEKAVYDMNCDHCIAREIKMMRSPDGKTSKRLQLGLLNDIGPVRAERVKAILRSEA